MRLSSPINFQSRILLKKFIETYSTDGDRISSFFEQIKMTTDECSGLESKTRKQSSSDMWVKARKWRLKASKHHEIYTYISSVAKSKGAVIPRTTPMAADIVFRPNSISHLEKEGVLHRNFKSKKCGLFVDGNRPYIGASPDALMECECHQKFVIEIKCLYALREITKLTLDNALKTDFLTGPPIQLKRNHNTTPKLIRKSL